MMIYLLEDDGSIRKLVVYALESQGYQAAGFETPGDFWAAMDGEKREQLLRGWKRAVDAVLYWAKDE